MGLCGNESPQENKEVRPIIYRILLPTMKLSVRPHLTNGFKLCVVREMSTWLISTKRKKLENISTT